MTGGTVFGTLFFVLLFAAALSSCIGCGEAVTSWVVEKKDISRGKAAFFVSIAAWVVGIGTILSFSTWSDFYPLNFIPAMQGMDIYVASDYLAANILLLIGSLALSMFFGWFVPKQLKHEALGLGASPWYGIWEFLLRFVIPVVLFVVLVLGLGLVDIGG